MIRALRALWDLLWTALAWGIVFGAGLLVLYILFQLTTARFSDGAPNYCAYDPAACERQGWP